MGGRSNRSLAALLLTQGLVDAPVPPLKVSEYWSVIERIGNPARLLGGDPAGVARAAGIDDDLADRIGARLDAATAFALQLDEAKRSGIRVIASVDDEYPSVLVDRLQRSAPPLLCVAGDPALVGPSLFGIVGSRDASEAAISVARETAAEGVRNGFGIVSGGARGTDRHAMLAALGAGGVVVGVLAGSLARALTDSDNRRMIGERQLCLCTAHDPTAGFSVPNAMGRNKIIYGLSKATMVVTSDLNMGGTWAGAKEALHKKTTQVLVWTGDGEGPGNAKLADLGAKPVASVEELFPLEAAATRPATAATNQLAMDV